MQGVESGDDVGRFGALGVVGVGERPADGADQVDDVRRGEREGARVTAVDAVEVEAELVVDDGEVVRQVEGEAVRLGDVGADVAEGGEVQGMLLGQGQ